MSRTPRIRPWVFLLAFWPCAAGAAPPFLALEDLSPDDLAVAGFDLPRKTRVQVDAVGLRARHGYELVARAWLLDAATRQVVWSMDRDRASRSRKSRDLVRVEETIELQPGRYEVYAFASSRSNWGDIDLHFDGLRGLRDFLRGLKRHDDDRDAERLERDLERERDQADREMERAEREVERARDKVEREMERAEREMEKAERDMERAQRDIDRAQREGQEDERDRSFRLKLRGTNDWRGNREMQRALRDCYVRLSSDDVAASQVKVFEPSGELAGALARHAQQGDDAFVETAFRLDRPASLRLYAFSEQPDDYESPVDHGWILDASTRQRVWEMTYRNTHHAGGADKNRVFDGQVRLDAGTYVLAYGTDDSHSYAYFNAMPPDDPLNWGITLLPGKDMDRGTFHVVDVPGRGTPLLELTRLGDGEFREQPFRLERDGELLVYAVGEYSDRDREFADGAWIQKAGGDATVWEMTYRNTAHAGGASKNRVHDGYVKLPAGDYIAYAVTDDSHSYRDWNAGAPFDPQAWGLTLYPGRGFDAKHFGKVAESALRTAGGDALVRLVHVGNDKRLRREFRLDKSARIRIYALGEGSRGEMYDFGTIVDKKSGDVVWEMTWRNTRHAGGARKNRVFDGEIRLDAGEYEVLYETDGSHAFPDWNDSRPRDPRSWGITVSRAD